MSRFFLVDFNAIILSKSAIFIVQDLPKLFRLNLIFFIDTNQYSKNIFLFYILLSIILGGVGAIKKKKISFLELVRVVIRKKCSLFLYSFIYFYLPILGSVENIFKLSSCLIDEGAFTKFQIYRINYCVFPVIPELGLISEEYTSLYQIIARFKLQLDIILKVSVYSSCSFLLHMHKVPCILVMKSTI